MSRSAAVKVQKKEQKERKTTEMKLKHLNLDDIHKEFPNLEQNTITDLSDIMSGAFFIFSHIGLELRKL